MHLAQFVLFSNMTHLWHRLVYQFEAPLYICHMSVEYSDNTYCKLQTEDKYLFYTIHSSTICKDLLWVSLHVLCQYSFEANQIDDGN